MLQIYTDKNLKDILERVRKIGKEVIAPNASDVDQKARFPSEAIEALKAEKLLSAYVPKEYGGMGLGISDMAIICETLAHYCGSTAMIYAMHQIQVACIVHHGLASEYFCGYLSELVEKQTLLASATTEIGIGGDLGSSICAVKVSGTTFTLEKQAPVISYGAHADAILVTCRKSEEAQKNDQVLVLVKKEDCTLKPLSGWDTLGFRGTCSLGFVLTSCGSADQIVPVPFGQILSQTMHPVSHLLWGSLWLGIATDSVELARSVVREAARKNPDAPPISALRLAEVDAVLFSMRGGISETLCDYHQKLQNNDMDGMESFGFAIRINNLKVTCSQMLIDIVGKALLICGISGYKNDSKSSLCRQLRDAYGASVMVNNDRILNFNASLQTVIKSS